MAIASWAACIVYPISDVHFGWIGTLFGSAAGLVATILSYRAADKVATRGGVVYKEKSPVQFFITYALVALLFAAFLFGSILGSLGMMK